MKKLISHIRFQRVLPLLFLAVLMTLPIVLTGSKYVWKNTIDITLKIVVDDISDTGGSSDRDSNRLAISSSTLWVQKLQNMEARATAEGLVLVANSGYMLPEIITVNIGQASFEVCTDGAELPEGIAFDPMTGLLSISENLIAQYPGEIMVCAIAVPKAVIDEDTVVNEDTAVEDDNSLITGESVEGDAPIIEETPVEETSPSNENESIGLNEQI